MKRALIIGASGQDGSYLAQLLLLRGIDVHICSRTSNISQSSGLVRLGLIGSLSLHELDTENPVEILSLFERVKPDGIFNLGGQSSVGKSFVSPSETLHSITTATINLLEALRLVLPTSRFYNAGSSECFGDCNGEPSNAATPFRPLSPYAAAKAAASIFVKNYRECYGLYCVTGHLFNHESRFRTEQFVTLKIIRAAERISRGSDEILYLGDCSVQRDWGWAPEFVAAMVAMLEQDTPADHVVATGHVMSIEQFVCYAFEQFGLDWRNHVKVDPSLGRPTELRISTGDPSDAERVLGWRAQTYGRALVQKLCREVTEDMK